MTTNFIDDFKGLVTQSGGLARSNVYSVALPLSIGTPIGSTGALGGNDITKKLGLDGKTMNMLCKSTMLPGRQLISHDRQIGMNKKKIAYGFAVDDITLTFHVMNDYKIKSYFDAWMNAAINKGSYEAGYYDDYVADVRIKQLRKGIGIPLFKKDVGGIFDDIPSNIKNRLPTIGPFDLSQGEISLALITGDLVMHEVQLVDCYPTSMNSITLSDGDANGLVELTVQLSYRDWYVPEELGPAEDIFSAIGTILDGIGIF